MDLILEIKVVLSPASTEPGQTDQKVVSNSQCRSERTFLPVASVVNSRRYKQATAAIDPCEIRVLRSSVMFSFRAFRLRRVSFPPQPYRFNSQTTFRLNHSKSTDVPTIYKPRREPWVNPTMLFIGFIPLFTFALGTWQLQRLQWKVALIDELEEKLQLQPISLPEKIK